VVVVTQVGLMDDMPVAEADNQEDDPFGDFPDEPVAVEAPMVVPEREQPESAAEAAEAAELAEPEVTEAMVETSAPQFATEPVAEPEATEALVELSAPEFATEPAAPAVKPKKQQTKKLAKALEETQTVKAKPTVVKKKATAAAPKPVVVIPSSTSAAAAASKSKGKGAARPQSPRLTHEQFVTIGRGRKAGSGVLVDPAKTSSPPKSKSGGAGGGGGGPKAAWRGARGHVPSHLQSGVGNSTSASTATPTRLAPKSRMKQRYPTAFSRPRSAPPPEVVRVEIVPKRTEAVMAKPRKRKVTVPPPPPPPPVAFQMRRAKSATARPRVWSPANQVEGVSHHATKASRLAAYYQRLQQIKEAAQVARLTAAEGEAAVLLPKSPPPKAPRAAASAAGGAAGGAASVEKLAGWGGDDSTDAKPVFSAVAAVPRKKTDEEAEVCGGGGGGGGPSAECVGRLSTPKLQRVTVHCTRVPPRKVKEAPEQQAAQATQSAVVSPTKRPRSAPPGGKAAKVERPVVAVLVQQRVPVAAVGQLRASQQEALSAATTSSGFFTAAMGPALAAMQTALAVSVPIAAVYSAATGEPRLCPEDFVDGETVVVCLPGESLRGVKGGVQVKELRKSARAAAKTAAAVTSRLFVSTPAPPRYRTVVLRAEGAPQVGGHAVVSLSLTLLSKPGAQSGQV